MSNLAEYVPGPAFGAQMRKKEGETWTLIVERELRHPPEKVWEAITDPVHLREWAPFDADGNLGVEGSAVKLTTVGAAKPLVTETIVTRADAPRALEYTWNGNEMKWELEAVRGGTRLTLWTAINRHFIAMGAAGWHVAFDALDRLLVGQPMKRIFGPEGMKLPSFQQLHAGYAKLFGVQMPNVGPKQG
ncbi:MAG TPA: SRPBCC domain-containing protein [Candidatus Sulfotelmatobacter sp.]|nr:SRPBCC domain-containing protein [Candidatus Sulfotelmatobacter sp.]